MRMLPLLLVAVSAVSVGPAGATAPAVSPTASPPADSAMAAGELTFSLVPPRDAVAAGAAIRIDLIALNAGEREIAFTPPGVLTAIASAHGQSRTVSLRADSVRATTLAPGTFSAQPYRLSLPTSLSGTVVLSLGPELGEGLRAVVQVVPAGGARASDEYELPPVSLPIHRAYRGRFGAHDSVYFIYGGEAPGAKFQVSLKYRLLTSAPPGSPWPQSLHFAYSQRSLWDITAESSPFYDTSYMPELFYESTAGPRPDDPGKFHWLGYQFGFGHESNGREGETGRSLNRLQVRSGVLYTLPAEWHILLTPQLYKYVFSLSDNPRIQDYRGYGKLLLAIGRAEGVSLVYTGQIGKHFEHPTHQLDLTVPARIPVLDFLALLMVQYFRGYGESLLSYDQRSDMLRAGFALVR